MNTLVIYPKNNVLKKYIQYFLFIRNSDPTYSRKHICYPNTNHCLGLHKGNKIERVADSEIRLVSEPSFYSYLTGIYRTPLKIHAGGLFNEVCIDFEPLGLEMLTGEKISIIELITDAVETVFPVSWSEIYYHAFFEEDPFICAQKLEEFFLKRISHRNQFRFIPFNDYLTSTVDELKGIFHLSYRSIHRIYRDSMNISPKEFLRIKRLRTAIDQLELSTRLGNVAFENGFTDQSHMIKEFKNFTGFTPQKLIERSKIIDEKVWWSIS